MTDCVEYEEFRYCTVDGVFMLGNNSEFYRNGLINENIYPSTVLIPRTIHNKAVYEIGSYALYRCVNIKRIIIEARITRIGSNAICSMKSLEYVRLPNTLEILENFSLHFWDLVENFHPGPGIATVIFEPNSKLKQISYHTLSYKDTLYIHTCEPIRAQIDYLAFGYVKTMKIFSPVHFSVDGHRSIQSNYTDCCPKITIRIRKHISTHTISFIFIILS